MVGEMLRRGSSMFVSLSRDFRFRSTKISNEEGTLLVSKAAYIYRQHSI